MTALLPPTRRTVAAGLGLTLASWSLAARPGDALAQPAGAPSPGFRLLTAAPTRLRLAPEPAPEVEAWAFDGRVPGPVIRVRHGEEVRVRLVNETPEPLSLHWQGVRIDNRMDGVGGLTQDPAPPGGSFEYRFTPPDPGTFLVRPLVIGGSSEPAERGLHALLVVEERDAPPVDRDVALVLDDWRLGPDGALAPFGNPLEAATAGRLGGLLTLDAAPAPQAIEAAPGSRIRLRLANACNARSLRIRFDDLRAYVAAVDGQPTDTFEPLRSTLPFAPGSRYDLLIDLPAQAGARGAVTALLGPGVPLVTLVSAGEPVSPRAPIRALSPNPRLPPEIKLQRAVRREVTIAGGAQAGPDGKPAFAGDPARIWTVNGAPGSAAAPPLFSVRRGGPVVLTVANKTPTPQPIHVHGHVFRLLHQRDDGWEPYWLDTLLIPEGRTVLLAMLADNPGRWAISSTVLERFDAGLWTWFEVT